MITSDFYPRSCHSQIDETYSYQRFMKIIRGCSEDKELEIRSLLSGMAEDQKTTLAFKLIDEIETNALCRYIHLFDFSHAKRVEISRTILSRRGFGIQDVYAHIHLFDLEDSEKKSIAEEAINRGDYTFCQKINLFSFDKDFCRYLANKVLEKRPEALYHCIHLLDLDEDAIKDIADKLLKIDPIKFCHHLHLFHVDRHLSKQIADVLLQINTQELCNCIHLLDLEDGFRHELAEELLKVNPSALYRSLRGFSLSEQTRYDIAVGLFETAPAELCSVIDNFELSADVRLRFAKELLKSHPEVFCRRIKLFSLPEAERIGLATQLAFQDINLLSMRIQNFGIVDYKARFMLYEMVIDRTQLEDREVLSRFHLLHSRQYSSNTVIVLSKDTDVITPGAIPFKQRLEFLHPEIETRLIYDYGVYGNEAGQALAEGDENTRVYIFDHGKPNSDSILSGDYKKVGDFIIANTPFAKMAKKPLRISLMTCESAVGGLHGELSFASRLHQHLSVSGVQSEICARTLKVASPLHEKEGKETRHGVGMVHQLPGSKLTFKFNQKGRQVIVDSYIEKFHRETKHLLHSLQSLQLKNRSGLKRLIKEIAAIAEDEELSSQKALLLLDKWKQVSLCMTAEQRIYKDLVDQLISNHEKSIDRGSKDPFIGSFILPRK